MTSRLLWGVQLVTQSGPGDLLGSAWAEVVFQRRTWHGEPARNLLFYSRRHARNFVRESMAKWRKTDPATAKRWRLRVVRVRETVEVVLNVC